MRSAALSLALALLGSPGGHAAGEPATKSADRGGNGASDYTAERVRSTVEEHVQRTARESGGVYRLPDERVGKTLDLEFVAVSLVGSGTLWKVHDPDRPVDAGAFFACIRFHPVGSPKEKLYDVDMLVEPRQGALAVTDVRIHKERRLVDGKWVWEVRRAPGAGAKRP